MLVYKILREAEWQAFEAAGETAGSPVDLRDGFVHLSDASQVAQTAAKHFVGACDLVLLAVDVQRLGSALSWEPSRGGALFPHLYRALRRDDVSWAKPLPFDGARHRFEGLVDAAG